MAHGLTGTFCCRLRRRKQLCELTESALSHGAVSCVAEEECPVQAAIGQSDFARSSHKSVLQKKDSVLAMADSGNSDDAASPPSKYKSSLLNRYLNDTLRHMIAAEASPSARKRRSHSESFSSSEDRDVVSPASSYETEANFVYQMGKR